MTPLASHLSLFLNNWLPSQKGSTRDTIETYKVGFKLFVCFAAKRHKCEPHELCVEQLDAPCVMAFLEHLEERRKNCARTRNARLAAIRSFMRFLEPRLPAALEQIKQILAIPTKRFDEKIVGFLDLSEALALLGAPNLDTIQGLRDRAMLVLGNDMGLRLTELVELKLTEVDLGHARQITVTGKGRKQRSLLLTHRSLKAIREYLAVRGDSKAPEIFLTNRGAPMTPRNFQLRVAKYSAIAAVKQPSLGKKRVSPHVLRHTTAMNVLASTKNIVKAALWLGHASTRTTEIYTRADPTQKLELVDGLVMPRLRRGTFKPPDAVLALLSSAAQGS